MADNTEKKILISVEILDNFIAAKKHVEEWMARLKEAQASGTKTAVQMSELAAGLIKANAQYKEACKAIQNASAAQDILSAANAKVNQSLAEMKSKLETLKGTSFNGLDAKQINEIELAMASLTAQISDYEAKLKGMDTGQFTNNIAGMAEAGNALLKVTGEVAGALGFEDEGFKELEKSIGKTIEIVNSCGTVVEFLTQKKWNIIKANIAELYSENNLKVAKLLGIDVSAAQAAAEEAMIVIKGRSSLASKAAAVAQWVWNSAILANPLVWFVVAIMAVIAGIVLLVKAFDSSAQAQERAAAAQASYEKQAKATADTIQTLDQALESSSKRLENQHNAELLALKEKHATSSQIAQAQARQAQETADLEIAASNKKQKSKATELNQLWASIAAQAVVVKLKEKGSQQYYEELTQLNILLRKRNELVTTINGEIESRQKLTGQVAEKEFEANKASETETKNKYYKLLDYQQKFAESQLLLSKDTGNQSFSYQQQFDADMFALSQKAAKTKLRAQLAAKDIEKTEYDQQKSLLKQAEEQFQKGQLDDLKKHNKAVFAEKQAHLVSDFKYKQDTAKAERDTELADAIAQGKLSAQRLQDIAIQDINDTYALKSAENQKNLKEDLSNAQEIADNEVLINKNKNAAIATSNANYRVSENNKAIAAEQGHLDLITSMDEEGSINWYNDRQKARQKDLEEKKKTVKDIIKLDGTVLTAQEQINDLILKADNESYQDRLKVVDHYYAVAQTYANSLLTLSKTQNASKLQDAEDTDDAEQASLSAKLKAGTITQAEYDKKSAASTAKLSKEKKKIAHDDAVAERNLAMVLAVINTALAVSKAVSSAPWPANIPAIIAAAATGAIQIATIAATPIPKAARGMIAKKLAYEKASRGTLLQGASHAQGGIPIEAEGGEAIINKKSTSMFAPLLSAINEAGGGVKFAQGGIAGMYAGGGIPNAAFTNDGGYSARAQENQLTPGDIKSAMQSAVSQVKIYTTVEDYRRADKNYTNIESAGSV